AGASPRDVVDAALGVIPDDSWTARTIRHVVAHPDDLDAVIVKHYPWTDVAPEAVALAIAAYLAGDGDVETVVTHGVGLGRDADTIGAISGAIAGAGQGEGGVPARWAAKIGPATGKCLPFVRGRHVLDVADELAERL
ncbi:MAG: ADP-ribosylglycohydrolase family protein, partial [Nonomuraea sp.]|nr:ADP-ribosylglycohydrolase family protein [Nonomuraea sp.]